MFLIFILTLCYAEQIFNKGYKQQTGQISIETDIFSRIHLTVGQKLVITVTNYQTHKLPLFMICRRFPSFKKVPDLFTLKSQKCVADLNAYDFQKDAQKIIIMKNEILEDYENQMFLTEDSNANILVYLETKSDFNIYFDLKDKNSCYSQCQNGSSCENGICICVDGFIGGDCSIPVLNFQLQNEFEPDIVYFIDTNTEKDLEVDFTDRSSYILQCISENPFLKRGQLLFNNTIEITEQSSQSCLLNSQTLTSQYKFQISPYYIFITNIVTHVQTYEDNNSQKNTIIYVVTSIGVSLIFIIIYCFFKCRKTQTRSNNLFQQQTTYTSMKLTILRSINKYMPIQNYIDVIKKFPGLQDEQSCQICLETYQNDHKVRVAYCTHFFHAECIDQWIEKHEICPACRSSFNIETLNKFNHTENDDQQYNICTSTKQIINDQSQRKIRLFGNNKSSSSPIQINPLHQSSQI